MRRPSRSTDLSRPREITVTDDDGSASLEFLVAGLVLLVPIVYLVVTLGMIQHAALGVEAAARHIARAASLAEDPEDAAERVQVVRAEIAAEYGLDADRLQIELVCVGGGSVCPVAGATVRVTARSEVALPLVPPVLGLDDLAAVPVEASAVQKVSRSWGP
ncbi:TadE family protein [Microbacterium sp. SORGH_AS_0888]|uniref:TadE family protein n=1 Tax=Microbacterium sp. SORGH_AS_0888 TaxID=3041791 RepID=UPI002782B8EF|nr:TadE family protein [Microbacterium sp. SORGH_AS_0888]MDQ1128247.1 Flp pilus assembly protein TadG [Microbacterium sp. SORGH_AS_0888]